MAKKLKLKIDGLHPQQLQTIRSAVRQVWQRCYQRRLVVTRSTDKDGYAICEKCKKRSPKNAIDHITPVGDLLNGGIERMFVSSNKLQALCKECHKEKTKKDNASTRASKKKRSDIGDFY